MTNSTCPIWGTAASAHNRFEDGSDHVDSPRAGGRYVVERETKADYLKNPDRLDDSTKARLTTWLVDQRRLGVDCPEVTFETIKDAKRRKPLAVHERADRLLRYLTSKSDVIGASIGYLNFQPPDEEFQEMLAHSESTSKGEVLFLTQYLSDQGWVDGTGTNIDYVKAIVTVPGYAHLAELEKKAVDTKQAFVAMWFDDSMAAAYEEGIAPAVRDAGYEPLRIDRKDHNNKIDDEIIAEIRRSRFLVADFTQGTDGPRGGVYYEAGFAHGIDIPVIFTCHEDTIDKVHFDTRQYNHITWKTPKELQTRLAQRIAATIGDGPLRKSG